MFTIEMVVADTDIIYLEALTKFLITYEQVTFLIHRFSDVNQLISFTEDNKDIHYVFSESIFQQLTQSNSMTHISYFAILVEDLVESHLNQYHLISKYEKGGQIANSISKWFAETSPKEIPKITNLDTSLISITQLQNNCDSLGHIIAQYILRFKKRVLYISFDILSNVPNFISVQESNTLSDLLFYVKKNIEKLGLMVESIKSTDETGYLDYIPTCLYANHLWEISEQELKDFVDYLVKYLGYDVIMFELDGQCSYQNKLLMSLCHHNLIVTSNDESIKRRTRKFMLQPMFENIEDLVHLKIQHHNTLQSIDEISDLDNTIQYSFPYNNNNLENDSSVEHILQTLVNEVIL